MISQILGSQVVLIDMNNRELTPVSTQMKSERVTSFRGDVMTFPGGGRRTLTLQWENVLAPPKAIVCRFPTSVEEKKVPFEFKEIPLP